MGGTNILKGIPGYSINHEKNDKHDKQKWHIFSSR